MMSWRRSPTFGSRWRTLLGGEKVAARVAFRGTHRGEFQGIAPTDKEVAFSEIAINRVVDGKVEEHWFEMDLLGLMGQLGAIPEPEHSSEEASPT